MLQVLRLLRIPKILYISRCKKRFVVHRNMNSQYLFVYSYLLSLQESENTMVSRSLVDTPTSSIGSVCSGTEPSKLQVSLFSCFKQPINQDTFQFTYIRTNTPSLPLVRLISTSRKMGLYSFSASTTVCKQTKQVRGYLLLHHHVGPPNTKYEDGRLTACEFCHIGIEGYLLTIYIT